MMDTDDQLLESLADAEHAGWARWMKYLFEQCAVNQDGSLTIPADLAAQWQRQIETRYADLSENEKEADRSEVRRILPLIHAATRRAGSGASRG
jgi:hypothetical protein